MIKHCLCILLMCLSIFRGYSHNGVPKNKSENWLLINITENNAEVTANPLDYLFYVYVENVYGDYASLGTADENGNSTEASFNATFGGNNKTTDHTYIDTDPSLFLTLVFSDFEDRNIGDDCFEVSIHIKVFKKDGTGMGEWKKEAGEWDWATEYILDVKSESNFSISVDPTTLAFCEGMGGQSVDVVATGASGDVTVTVADGGGAKTFNPAYATISGNKITFSPNCPAGNYTVAVSATDGTETANTTFELTVYERPEVAITTVPDVDAGTQEVSVCSGSTVALTANIRGGTPDYTYKWFNDTDRDDINMSSFSKDSVTVTGKMKTSDKEYTVYVQDANGCLDTATVTARKLEAPNILLQVNGKGYIETKVCKGEPVLLEVVNNRPETLTYSWQDDISNHSTTRTVYVDKDTSFTVTAVNGNGCVTSVTKQLKVNPKPEIELTQQPDSVCLGNPLDLSTAVYANIGEGGTLTPSYFDAGWNAVSATIPAADLTIAQTYTYWLVGKTTLGCSDTVKLSAKVNPLPPKPTISGPTESCQGHPVVLKTTPGMAGYSWSDGTREISTTDSAVVSPNAATSYTVVVKDANGCESEASDPHTMNVHPSPTVVIDPYATAICSGSDIDLTATVSGGTPSYKNYTWSNNKGSIASVNASDSTKATVTIANDVNTIALTVTDQNGCQGSSSIDIRGNYISVNLIPNSAIISLGANVDLTAITTENGVSVRPGDGKFTWTFTEDPGSATQTGDDHKWSTPLNGNTLFKVRVERNDIGCWAEDTLRMIPQATPLVVVGTSPSAICYNETDFDGKWFIAKTTGGVPTYHYAWTYPNWLTTVESGDTLKITGIDYSRVAKTGLSSSTLVSCKVTDSNSPAASRTVNFTININPYTHLSVNTQTDGGELRVCVGSDNGQYTLTASGAATYNWLEPAGSAGTTNPLVVANTVADATGTVYKVTGKDAKGCQTDTVGVTLYIDALSEIQSLTAAGNVTQVCPGTTVLLTATASGAAPLTYTWNKGGNGNNTANVTPTATDTMFTVSVTDVHGCIQRDTIFIKNYIQDKIQITPATYALCEGDSVELTVSGLTTDGTTPAPGTSYSWSGGELTAPVTGLTFWAKPVATGENTYIVTSVTGMDGHGCTVVNDTAKVTLNAKPVLVITDPDAVCEPNTVNLTAAAVTQGSTLPAGTRLSYYNDLALTNVLTNASAVAATGTYYIKAENPTSGCWDMDSVHVVVSPQPTVVVKDVAVCAPNTVDLSVDSITAGSSSGLTYSYYYDAAGTSAMPSSVVSTSGDYYIKGTAPGGCFDIKKVHVDVFAIPTVTLAADTNVCENAANVQITAGGADSYKWLEPNNLVTSDPTGSVVRLTLSADLTKITVAGTTNGCSDTVSINIHRIPLPEVTIDGPTAGCSNEVIALTADTTGLTNGPFTYTWTKATATTANAATATLSTTNTVKNDTIKVHVTDRYGCEGPESLLVVKVNGFQPTLEAQLGGTTITTQIAPETPIDLVAGPTGGDYEYKFLKVKTPVDSLIRDWAAANTVNYKVTKSANYKVLVRNKVTGCVDSVTVNVPVTGETLSITGDSVAICYQLPSVNQIVTAQAEGGRMNYTYTWGTLTGLTLGDVAGHPEQKEITSVAGLAVGEHNLQVTVTDANGTTVSTYVKITINALPTVQINGEQNGADISSCQYSTAVVMTASGTTNPAGGTLTYKWQTPAGWDGAFSATTTQTVNMTLAGAQDYKVVAQDQYGCQDTATRRVMVNPVPVVTIELSGDTCRGSEVTLTAHASSGTLDAGQSYAYSWTGATVTAKDSVATAVLVDNANHFEVEITDSKGCQATVSRDVNVTPLNAVLVANPASVTAGQSSTLIASPNGDGSYTYEFLLVSGSGVTSLSGAVDSSLVVSPIQTTDYKVVVTNAIGCRDTSEVATVTVTGEKLALNAAQDTICAANGEEYVLVSRVTGGSSAKTYVWRSLDAGAPVIKNNVTNQQDLTLVLAGETGGAYRYEITVTDGSLTLKDTASLYLNVKPEIASLAVLDSCTNYLKVKVNPVDPTLSYRYSWYYSTNVIDRGRNSRDSTIRTFEITGNDPTYTVSVVAKVGSCQDSIGISGEVLDLGLQFALDMGTDTCGSVSELPISALHKMGKGGNYKVDYEYTPWGGTPQRLTYDLASGTAIPVAGAGTYRMLRYYNDKYPGCALELKDSVNVENMPDFVLSDNCLALNKDSIFNLSVENSTNYNYIWHAAEYDGAAWADITVSGDATQSTIVGHMGDRDLQYIIEISSKNLPACKFTDTAHIYRIPDAPVIDIDTINDKYHVQITWSAVAGADGYTIWSRKWDPYCVTNIYTGDTLYHEEPTATNIPALSWAEPKMDSLKYFYLTAVRQNICGSMVHSLSSADTVGYKLDSLHVNTDNTSNNPVTLMFESKYFHDTKELLLWIEPEYSTTVFWWNMAAQATSNTTYRNDDWDALLPSYTPAQLEGMGIYEYIDVAPLEVSRVYFIAAAKKTAFLQFGKLSSLMKYRLENTATSTSNNIVSLLLQKSYYFGTIDLFKGLTPSRVDAIRLWDFASQAWTLSTNRNPDWDALLVDFTPAQLEGMGIFEYDSNEDYRLYPALPIQISYVRQSDSSSYIWK